MRAVYRFPFHGPVVRFVAAVPFFLRFRIQNECFTEPAYSVQVSQLLKQWFSTFFSA